MAGLTLREALKSLCSDNGWSYAVFWKLNSRDRMILTWEDGHYQSMKPPVISKFSTLTTPDSLLKGWDTGGKPLNYGAHNQDGCSMRDQIGLLVAKMSPQMHSLGEGIIGNIAVSGNYQWIFQENFLVPFSSFEYPDGWQNQFAAGIKTIAVIAAPPYGVVQLGSSQTIMEDFELVRHVKSKFESIYNVSRPFSHACVEELLSGRVHGTQQMTVINSATRLHGIPAQSMPKNPSSNVSEQGGDLFSITGMSKGFQAEAYVLPSVYSTSTLSKPLSQFSQLQQKRMQLNSHTPSITQEQSTLPRETRTQPSARVIYSLQSMIQANSREAGNSCQSVSFTSGTGNKRLALMEQQLVKELGLQGQIPQLHTNSQSTVQTSFQNNTVSAFQEASSLSSRFGALQSNNSDTISHCNLREYPRDEGFLRTVLFESGPPHISTVKQSESLPSVPALHDVLRQHEHSASSSVLLVNTNQVERTDRNPLGELDISCPAYEDSMFSSSTTQVPVSAERHPYYTSWDMTTGQLETALQETGSNDLIASSRDDFSISADLGAPHPWEKDITTKDVYSFLQDVMVDNLYSVKESSKVSEVSFGEDLTAMDEYAPYALDDDKSLTKGQESNIKSIPLPTTDELFDVLGPAFRKTQDQVIWDDISLPMSDGSNGIFLSHSRGVSAGSACPSEVDLSQTFDAFKGNGLKGGFLSESKSEHLLDAVVANILSPINHSVDDNTTSKITSRLSNAPALHSSSVKADSCFTGPLSGSEQSKYVGNSKCSNSTSVKTVKSSFTSGFQGETSARSSPDDSSLKTQPSLWIDDSKSAKCENAGLAQSKKSDEPVKVNRKRAKPGESTRPRPKDRQQIQDRVKELREIVPNGTKCSIDALLERTIKHMIFLQSVTKHADKLKQNGEPKVLDKDGCLREDNLEAGASWAFEVGGQSMACPIMVENMSQPRQMLVEMLCEERGLFLEIADIIRGLGLTILKGVMEAHKDKIWARFAVEANRDVHRLEILWSLMQLLQQNTKSSTTSSNQPSVVTHQSIDSGSQALNAFQQPPLPPTLSITERLH